MGTDISGMDSKFYHVLLSLLHIGDIDLQANRAIFISSLYVSNKIISLEFYTLK